MYTVYRTTNLVNSKFYIGVHKTNDPSDNYLGSGDLLGKAIQKYGVSNFKKDVLFSYDTPTEAYDKEKEILVEGRKDPLCYNLMAGGTGGWDRIFTKEDYREIGRRLRLSIVKRMEADPEFRSRCRKNLDWTGRSHSLDSRIKISQARRLFNPLGVRNPQYGKVWVTRDGENKMVVKDSLQDYLKSGWKKGRKLGTVGVV